MDSNESSVSISLIREYLPRERCAPFEHRDLVKALNKAKRRRLLWIDYGAPRGKEML
jgi:hypothetical protein